MKLLVAILAVLAIASSAGACGKERWSVKTLTDSHAKSVDFTAHSTSVAALGNLSVPSVGYSTPRLALERHVYRVNAELVKVKLEDDEDYHLVLQDGDATMIAESPAVSCTYGAQHRYAMAKARKAVEKIAGKVSGRWHYVGKRVLVTGVFFVDENHGQTGMAPNAAELHPILGVRVG